MQCQQHPTPRELLERFRAMGTAQPSGRLARHKGACLIKPENPETQLEQASEFRRWGEHAHCQ